jgi:hypothetical protein
LVSKPIPLVLVKDVCIQLQSKMEILALAKPLSQIQVENARLHPI